MPLCSVRSPWIAVCVVLISGSVGMGQERSTGRVLFQESFNDAELGRRGWYDISRVRLADQAFAGKSCIEYDWMRAGEGVSGSATIRHLFEPTDRVYLRFQLKLSKDWGWTGRNYHPHLIQFMTTEDTQWHGPAASHLTVYVEPVNGKLRLAAQDIQNRDQPHGLTQGPIKGGYNGKFYDSRERHFRDDAWHCVEVYFQLNTLDKNRQQAHQDGILRAWFDGQLVVEETNVVLRSADFPAMKFNQMLLAPYFGPGLVPHAQKLWIDEVLVATERVEAKNAIEK
ncbi:MAG: hypothetical protein Q8K78_05175 [Planctomycetaceae bacterium]|nr:hypothetical protein [Planctomycetaceae bacterium]